MMGHAAVFPVGYCREEPEVLATQGGCAQSHTLQCRVMPLFLAVTRFEHVPVKSYGSGCMWFCTQIKPTQACFVPWGCWRLCFSLGGMFCCSPSDQLVLPLHIFPSLGSGLFHVLSRSLLAIPGTCLYHHYSVQYLARVGDAGAKRKLRSKATKAVGALSSRTALHRLIPCPFHGAITLLHCSGSGAVCQGQSMGCVCCSREHSLGN